MYDRKDSVPYVISAFFNVGVGQRLRVENSTRVRIGDSVLESFTGSSGTGLAPFY